MLSDRKNDIKQTPGKHFLHSLITVLVTSPVLSFLVHKEIDLADPNLQLARIRVSTKPQNIANQHTVLLVLDHPSTTHSNDRFLHSCVQPFTSNFTLPDRFTLSRHAALNTSVNTQNDNRKWLPHFMRFSSTDRRLITWVTKTYGDRGTPSSPLQKMASCHMSFES